MIGNSTPITHNLNQACQKIAIITSNELNLLLQAGGVLGAIQDGGTGTAMYTVTCSADGTKWEADGQTITGVECSAVPRKSVVKIYTSLPI